MKYSFCSGSSYFIYVFFSLDQETKSRWKRGGTKVMHIHKDDGLDAKTIKKERHVQCILCMCVFVYCVYFIRTSTCIHICAFVR